MKSDYRYVTLTGGFWKQKEDTNRDSTIPVLRKEFQNRINAFRCEWKEGMPDRPHIFWDSDLAKWMEGVSYALSREELPELEQQMEALIDQIEKNQWEDGYFNSYYTTVDPANRFTDRSNHELYCAGHLIEAAVAYYEATGRDRFLRLMEKYASLIKDAFMNGTAQVKPTFITPGHEEIELALFRLYRATGNREWLELCAFFLNQRGNNDKEQKESYSQSHLPIRKMRQAQGHAVRMMYLASAMADLAGETGDEELLDTCRQLYSDIVQRKMYITGGVGASRNGEAFSFDYDLSNDRGYAETCAAIGMLFFCHRMNLLEREAKYADVIEKALYNGILAGMTVAGDRFFYNGLPEITLRNKLRTAEGFPHTVRQTAQALGCICCPPNLTRLMGSLGQYFYSWEDKKVWINQFGDSVLETDGIRVTQNTEYPNNGKIVLHVEGTEKIYVRIPGWCREFAADCSFERENGYAVFAGQTDITVYMTMEPTLMQVHTAVYKNVNKAALQYGPLVYCTESIDYDKSIEENGSQEILHSLYFHLDAPDWQLEPCEMYGCPVITCNGYRRLNAEEGQLYYPMTGSYAPERLRMIPFYAHANREESSMLVYLHYR